MSSAGQRAYLARRRETWRALLRVLTDHFPSWVAFKNLDSTLNVPRSDLDSLADRSEWSGIQESLIRWARDYGFACLVVCEHNPDGRKYIAIHPADNYVFQVDIEAYRSFRLANFIGAEDAKRLAVTDSSGVRRLHPGSEGVVKLCLNGTTFGGSANEDGLRRKAVRELLRDDPDGADTAVTLLGGPAHRQLRNCVAAVQAGTWKRGAMITVNALYLLRALRTPQMTLRRMRYRQLRRTHPPICSVRTLDRKVPDDVRAWIREFPSDHHSVLFSQ